MDYDIDRLVQEYTAAAAALSDAYDAWMLEPSPIAAQALGNAQYAHGVAVEELAIAVAAVYAAGGRVVYPTDSTDSTQ